jgi:hypothetical protein
MIWSLVIPRYRVIQLLTRWNPETFTSWDNTHTHNILNVGLETPIISYSGVFQESADMFLEELALRLSHGS